MEPAAAVLIREALTGDLADGSRPGPPRGTPLAKAQAGLHRTASAVDDGPGAARTRLTPSAITAMVGWALTAGEDPVGAG